MQENVAGIKLTVLITVVSGVPSMRENLKALIPQIDFHNAEVIVPFDRFSSAVGELAKEFPQVQFHLIDDLGLAECSEISSHGHRLYDRRRAVGLQLARGSIVAMLEDHGIPASDWVAQLLGVHRQKHAVIGGAIQNGEDKSLNWAVYYCDFGRYGLPFESRPAQYVSDVNVAYKHEALAATEHLWRDAYHETQVHDELLSSGETVFLDNRPIVYQKRKSLKVSVALTERVQWGRMYAETRTVGLKSGRRFAYAAGTILLPAILLRRAFGHMRRQGTTFVEIVGIIPFLSLLLPAWAVGEFLGYVSGPSAKQATPTRPMECDINVRV